MKKIKKLPLRRDTIRLLTVADTRKAKGGCDTGSITTEVPEAPSASRTCDTLGRG